jgi:threonyl-tRNA synthetase
VAAKFREAGVRVELDERNEKIGYKIRDWELKKVAYMVIVGEKERSAGNISVRQHKKGDLGSMEPDGFLKRIVEIIKTKSLTL